MSIRDNEPAPIAPPPPAKRNRRPGRAVWAVAAVALLAAVWLAAGSRSNNAASGVTYEFGEVTRGDVRSSVSATGTIQPWKVVDIKSNVAGRIDLLAVDLGDRVRAGQLIAVIDPTDTQTAVTQARADLAAARARAGQAEAASRAQPELTTASIQQASAALASARKAEAQARRQLEQLQQQLAELKDVTIPQSIEDAASNVYQARANVAAARAELQRQQELVAKGYSSRSELEAAEARLATVEASLRIAEQRQKTLARANELAVKELESRIEQTRASIEESQARIRQQEAALRLARANAYQDRVRREELAAAQTQIVRSSAQLKQAATNLGYTRITAPRDGIVLVKNVEEGTVVPSSRGSIGSTNALLQIGDVSRLWVVCKVDETDIAQVRVGQPVRVTVDAYPERPQRGRVIRIDPQAVVEQSVTTIPVTVELDRSDPRLKPGMNANCDFILKEARNVLRIPNEALRETGGKYSVQKLEDGKEVDVPIRIGVMGDEFTQVLSGLKEGEQVITRINRPEDTGPNNPLQFGPPRRPSGTGGRQGTGGAGGGMGRPGAGGGPPR